MSYDEGIKILASYGIPVARGGIAKSTKEAIEIARRIGYPVALKAISPGVSHKTEAKAVRLDVGTDAELLEAYNEVTKNLRTYDPHATIKGVLVQEMLKTGTEVIVGISNDPQFGPVIIFGLGGIFVEVLEDVSLRVLPITRYDAEQMVNEIKGYKVLSGFRGKPKADVEAIIDVLLKASKLSMDMKDGILEVDLNPMIVQSMGKGTKVVDARFIVPEEMYVAGTVRRNAGR